MLGICCHEMAEMVDAKIKDEKTPLELKEALFKLELGLRSVEVVELRMKLQEKVKLYDQSKDASDK